MEKYKIKAERMDSLRRVLDIRRIPNARINKLCCVKAWMKGLTKRPPSSGHIERMDDIRIAKRVWEGGREVYWKTSSGLTAKKVD